MKRIGDVKLVRLTLLLPEGIKEIAEECVEDGYLSMQEFIRSAVREKVRSEAPHLYRRLLNGEAIA